LTHSIIHESLKETVFNTGDAVLDELLEVSRQKFLHRSLSVRRESLEKLWDAWERLKTVEPGRDKQTQVKELLDRAATESNFRDRLEKRPESLRKSATNS
jgi:hypothetical protein